MGRVNASSTAVAHAANATAAHRLRGEPDAYITTSPGWGTRIRTATPSVEHYSGGGPGGCQSNYACPVRAAPGFLAVTSALNLVPFTGRRNAPFIEGRRFTTPRPTLRGVGRGAGSHSCNRWSLLK